MAGFKDNAKQTLKVTGLLAAYGTAKAIEMGSKGAAAFTDAVDAGAKYLYDRRDLAVPAFKGVIDAIETMPRDFHMWVVGEKVEKFRREMLANLILQARSRRYLTDQLATLVARSRNNKAAMLDYFAIGGQTLADYLDTGDVPDHVLRAYDLAYPNEAATMSFVEKVRSLDANQLEGFSAAVKGKLFEIDYVEYLNDGHLPEGYQADLADDPTQAGWDIKVTGPDGHIADAIQLKATNSVSYVGEALKRYPEIDVVTTDEVHSHLQMLHDVEHVTNSGIANADLASTVADATEGAALHMHWAPSIVSSESAPAGRQGLPVLCFLHRRRRGHGAFRIRNRWRDRGPDESPDPVQGTAELGRRHRAPDHGCHEYGGIAQADRQAQSPTESAAHQASSEPGLSLPPSR